MEPTGGYEGSGTAQLRSPVNFELWTLGFVACGAERLSALGQKAKFWHEQREVRSCPTSGHHVLMALPDNAERIRRAACHWRNGQVAGRQVLHCDIVLCKSSHRHRAARYRPGRKQ
jgi:hypothetical protein